MNMLPVEDPERLTSLGYEVVDQTYFRDRAKAFEVEYQESFPGGWIEFLMMYESKNTDPNNLDFDEWAFLCEHLVFEEESMPLLSGCGIKLDGSELSSGLSTFRGRMKNAVLLRSIRHGYQKTPRRTVRKRKSCNPSTPLYSVR